MFERHDTRKDTVDVPHPTRETLSERHVVPACQLSSDNSPSGRKPSPPAFAELLDALDERVQKVEFSYAYAKTLTCDDLTALIEKAARNGIPVRIG